MAKPYGFGYMASHMRVKRSRGLASQHACIGCGKQAKDWAYMGGCPDELVSDNAGHLCTHCPHPEHYEPRCRSCHSLHDAWNSGERNGRATISAAQARGIRASVLVDQNGRRITQLDLAKALGVSHRVVRRVRRGESWK